MIINEEVIIQEYEVNKKSIHEISKLHNTYPKMINNILTKHGVRLRTKSEAQKLALEMGKSVHPTKGKTLSDETKSMISAKNAKVWDNKNEDQINSFKEKARENWFKKSAEERHEMSKMAASGLYNASKNGSKAERFICDKLIQAGYNPQTHRHDIGGSYEVDIYLPDHTIAIEIDGPHHFNPIFGEVKLQKSVRFDSVKNGILISKGISIIRARHLKKGASQSVLQELWSAIDKTIKEIISTNGQAKLIELEV